MRRDSEHAGRFDDPREIGLEPDRRAQRRPQGCPAAFTMGEHDGVEVLVQGNTARLLGTREEAGDTCIGRGSGARVEAVPLVPEQAVTVAALIPARVELEPHVVLNLVDRARQDVGPGQAPRHGLRFRRVDGQAYVDGPPLLLDGHTLVRPVPANERHRVAEDTGQVVLFRLGDAQALPVVARRGVGVEEEAVQVRV